MADASTRTRGTALSNSGSVGPVPFVLTGASPPPRRPRPAEERGGESRPTPRPGAEELPGPGARYEAPRLPTPSGQKCGPAGALPRTRPRPRYRPLPPSPPSTPPPAAPTLSPASTPRATSTMGNTSTAEPGRTQGGTAPRKGKLRLPRAPPTAPPPPPHRHLKEAKQGVPHGERPTPSHDAERATSGKPRRQRCSRAQTPGEYHPTTHSSVTHPHARPPHPTARPLTPARNPQHAHAERRARRTPGLTTPRAVPDR